MTRNQKEAVRKQARFTEEQKGSVQQARAKNNSCAKHEESHKQEKKKRTSKSRNQGTEEFTENKKEPTEQKEIAKGKTNSRKFRKQKGDNENKKK